MAIMDCGHRYERFRPWPFRFRWRCARCKDLLTRWVES